MVVITEDGVDCEGKKRKRRPVLCRGGCRTWISRGGEECGMSSSDEDNCTRKRSLVEIYERCPLVLDDNVKECRKKRGRKKSYENIVCKKCGDGDGDDTLLLCDGCDNGYHMYCLCPILVRIPRDKWFCPTCSGKDCISEFPLVQKKIIDFFRIKRPLKILSEVKRRRRHNLCMHKKKQKLLPHVPSKDLEQRLRQMASLATALTRVGVDFSDELTYIPGLAPRSANRVEFERDSMQVIGKEDKATFELCKLMCARGEWPPLMVSHDPREGFVVEADSHIKDMTLIAEYTGDVDYMQNRECDESDSLMGLLFSNDPSKELVICPDKRGNIARFVSGINNHTREGRKKQNLRCVRFNIDGEARALLVAFRDISKGERLYYDYNAFRQEYPTEHFV